MQQTYCLILMVTHWFYNFLIKPLSILNRTKMFYHNTIIGKKNITINIDIYIDTNPIITQQLTRVLT